MQSNNKKGLDAMQEKALIKKNINNKKMNRDKMLLIIIVITIVAIDQISKIIILNQEELSIIPGILKLKVTQNTDGAYGIGSNSTIMYILTNLVILGIIFKFITTQNEYVDTKFKIFLSFILGGGISNVLDRIFHGYVVEFIDFKQFINIPIFNIADLFVIIGWVSVAAIFAWFTVNEWRKKE